MISLVGFCFKLTCQKKRMLTFYQINGNNWAARPGGKRVQFPGKIVSRGAFPFLAIYKNPWVILKGSGGI